MKKIFLIAFILFFAVGMVYSQALEFSLSRPSNTYYSMQEILNLVYKANTLGVHGYSGQEVLNAVFSITDSSLKVTLNGGDATVDSLDARIITVDTLYVYDEIYIFDATGADSTKIYDNGTYFIIDSDNIVKMENDVVIDSSLTLQQGTSINEFSTDGTLVGDSDDAVPTEKAIKPYIDALGAGVWTRTGTTLSPTNEGDDIDGTGGYLLDNQSITNLSSKGAGYWFDGTDDIVTVVDDAKITNIFDDGGSVSAWIYPLSDGGGNRGYICDKSFWLFGVRDDDGTNCKLRLWYSFSGDDGNWESGVVLPLLKWSHVCVTYDNGATTNNPILYINGLPVAASESGTPTNTRDTDAGNDFNIGNVFALNRVFDGEIQDVKSFNNILTATEVKDLSSGTEIPYKYMGASQTEQTSGTLTIGKAYRIKDWITDDDFTNVGGTNEDGNEFVATGTTPTTWTNNSKVVQIGCVANYTPEGIGHNQWLDNSGNELNGEVSGAVPINLTTDDTQTLVFKDVHEDKVYTNWLPAGYAITSIFYEETGSGQITDFDIGWSNDGGQIVADNTISADDEGQFTLLQGLETINADDDIHIDGTTWTGTVNLFFNLQRIKVID